MYTGFTPIPHLISYSEYVSSNIPLVDSRHQTQEFGGKISESRTQEAFGTTVGTVKKDNYGEGNVGGGR